jgi:hypothetical protein
MNGTEHGHCPPERLEDAARGHLDPAHLLEIENHCASCRQCRDAYAEERRIARGARSWARAALKKRLAGAVAEERATAIPWPRIVAIAAMLLVIAGTGIVYRWLHRIPQEPLMLTESVVTDSNLAPAQPLVSADQKDHTMPAAAPAAPQRAKTDAAPEQYSSARREREPALEARSVPTPAPAQKSELADAEESLAKSLGAGQIIWGTLLTPEEDKKGYGSAQAENQQKQQTQIIRNGMGSSGQRALDTRAQGGIGASAFSAPARIYVVTQQNILAMMRRDADERPDAVPARVTRTGDTIHVVLLLQSLLSPEALRAASIVECTPDSFQVVVRGRNIGFRIPGGQK